MKRFFKHPVDGSDDEKLEILFDEFGHKGVLFWWLLMEMCYSKWDLKSEPVFTFHVRTMATKFKSSSSVVRSWMERSSSLGLTTMNPGSNEGEPTMNPRSILDQNQIKFKIPKMLELMERNSKSRLKKFSNESLEEDEEEEEDEERDKKKTESVETSPPPEPTPPSGRYKKPTKKPGGYQPLIDLFADSPDVVAWLKTGAPAIQERLFQKFDDESLVREITKAFDWKSENKPSYKSGTFLTGWLDRCREARGRSGMKASDEDLSRAAFDFHFEAFGEYHEGDPRRLQAEEIPEELR